MININVNTCIGLEQRSVKQKSRNKLPQKKHNSLHPSFQDRAGNGHRQAVIKQTWPRQVAGIPPPDGSPVAISGRSNPRCGVYLSQLQKKKKKEHFLKAQFVDKSWSVYLVKKSIHSTMALSKHFRTNKSTTKWTAEK
ncbi:hypothetical protein CEXT_627261 [Caerostris extrusa]|uniref:Uncharacterized protein n=1 Tax=Caerostris extrusa TaxID=172846 RepID=A0AAV4QYN2_CAEEX|nr:hypothetical protein CEXT_627261 [Caerostris extrusa]